MLPLSRTSKIVDNMFKKRAFVIERISQGITKKDPFENLATNNVWKIKGNKLLKNKKFK